MGLTSQLPGVGSLTAIPLADLSAFAACLVVRLFSVPTWKPKWASLHLGVLLCVNNQISSYKKQKQNKPPAFLFTKPSAPQYDQNPRVFKLASVSLSTGSCCCHLSLLDFTYNSHPERERLAFRRKWGEPRAVNLPLMS